MFTTSCPSRLLGCCLEHSSERTGAFACPAPLFPSHRHQNARDDRTSFWCAEECPSFVGTMLRHRIVQQGTSHSTHSQPRISVSLVVYLHQHSISRHKPFHFPSFKTGPFRNRPVSKPELPNGPLGVLKPSVSALRRSLVLETHLTRL